MEKHTKLLISAFVLLVGISVAGVLFYGIRPKVISKITISVFENPDVVVNSLFLSMNEELETSPIFFVGIDTSDPFFNEVYQKILVKSQSLPRPFDAIVTDSSLPPQTAVKVDTFSIKAEMERFLSGVRMVKEKKLRLLVVVPTIEASARLPGSLISISKKSIDMPMMGLVFTTFPRSREQEANLAVPCNTGEEDLGGTAPLGCFVLQKARSLYKKRFPPGVYIGLLDQTGGSEFDFLLTRQP
jgi:hypothetical protein